MAGNETCDNKGQLGCIQNCQVDTGYKCLIDSNQGSVCWQACGDRILDANEQCDNGNQTGCKNCVKSVGHYCTVVPNTISVCTTQCGDSIKADAEDCDNGNQVGCSAGCKVDKGYTCDAVDAAGKSICKKNCGNKIRDAGEQCDNGNVVGCKDCMIDQGYYCKENQLGESSCLTICGDSIS